MDYSGGFPRQGQGQGSYTYQQQQQQQQSGPQFPMSSSPVR